MYNIFDASSGTKTAIKMREAGKNITIRVGGGYITLQQWIAQNDPWYNDPRTKAAVDHYRENQEILHADFKAKMPVRGEHLGIMTTRPTKEWLIKT